MVHSLSFFETPGHKTITLPLPLWAIVNASGGSHDKRQDFSIVAVFSVESGPGR